MGQVYSQASEVIVWLGEGDEKISDAVQALLAFGLGASISQKLMQALVKQGQTPKSMHESDEAAEKSTNVGCADIVQPLQVHVKYTTGLIRSSVVVLKDLQTLKVKAVPVDVIENVVTFGETWLECLESLLDVARLAQDALDVPLVTGDLQQGLFKLRSSEPLWRLLVDDGSEYGNIKQGFAQGLEGLGGASGKSTAPDRWEAMYEDLLTLCQEGRVSERTTGEYAEWLQMLIRRKTFFTTKYGFIGKSGKDIQAGDEIHVWLGVRGLFITRPSGDESNTCRVVSGAYVGGLMKGDGINELHLQGLIEAKELLVR
ncbi:hypothetical protein TI39_contig437g00003 [Zymoseptoria brevis]|uniref:Heterokaryon incompatibility domain-containing protein n=1 Tax=Zymoseptoria brevis TaxID=1047168 RepID=A0A0F4GL04_9PEZI|nr:hypothetical protein TI39_contig437g00003 [Zymoseptoria brevis]